MATSGDIVTFSTTLDLNKANDHLIVNVLNYKSATVQVSKVTGSTWATAVVTIQQSNDNVNFYAFGSAVTVAVGGGVTATIDVSAIASIRIVVTTAEGSAATGAVTVVRKRDS